MYRHGKLLAVIAFCAFLSLFVSYGETPAVAGLNGAADNHAGLADASGFLSTIASANDGLYNSLQSFVCTERIERFASRKRTEAARHLDTLSAQVSFENGQEHYSQVKRDEESVPTLASVVGAWSEGEFGTLLRQTEDLLRARPVQWDGDAQMSGKRVSLVHFTVREQDSPWDLEVAGRHYRVPFRAEVWVEKSSGEIVKITRTSLGAIGDTRIGSLIWSVTLSPVQLNGRSWLLPKEGMYSVEYANSRREWNELSFANYHRYGAEVALRFNAPN